MSSDVGAFPPSQKQPEYPTRTAHFQPVQRQEPSRSMISGFGSAFAVEFASPRSLPSEETEDGTATVMPNYVGLRRGFGWDGMGWDGRRRMDYGGEELEESRAVGPLFVTVMSPAPIRYCHNG
ncbi:uncharacterized protein CLUP02_04411 [Colletotrichum lupini]|uniref:Uncharacterized protein n=1 Tax=Colletotrichum lupini TaxID=145971 RepID=A0A9Q8SM18_9PEZI|nr:uncharacterized protein CLUP02_04411 [Colletotrichum lupini]UQC78932.1 hypothetical protein CLUP02_04411 [Colletotrichum lupini]